MYIYKCGPAPAHQNIHQRMLCSTNCAEQICQHPCHSHFRWSRAIQVHVSLCFEIRCVLFKLFILAFSQFCRSLMIRNGRTKLRIHINSKFVLRAWPFRKFRVSFFILIRRNHLRNSLSSWNTFIFNSYEAKRKEIHVLLNIKSKKHEMSLNITKGRQKSSKSHVLQSLP